MNRRFSIAVVVLLIGALVAAGSSVVLASGEDTQAEAKKETKAEAAPAADATPADAKAKEEADATKDAAKKELEDAKFNTLEDLFALVARPAITVAETSTGSPKPATAEPAAPGVEWRRVAESTDEGSD